MNTLLYIFSVLVRKLTQLSQLRELSSVSSGCHSKIPKTVWLKGLPRWGFSGSSVGKASAYNEGDPGLIPGSEDPVEK